MQQLIFKDCTISELLSVIVKKEMGEKLLIKFGNLKNIEKVGIKELMEFGLTNSAAKKLLAAIELGKRYYFEKPKKDKITCPLDAVKIIGPEMQWLDRETLRCLYLDIRNCVLAASTITTGILDSCLIHPREVYKDAVKLSAASLIVAHNHPSGDPSPSKEDILLTKQLKESGKILGIKLIDHIIIGECGAFMSLKEMGLC